MTSKGQDLVSIAMCTYNGEKFLAEQLDSIVNQTYQNLEIIIVDDRSNDNTLDILKQYELRHPNLKVYQNESNLGYIKNFERAISLCSGDFIALSDQDDIWDLRKIELQLSNISSNLLTYHNSEFINSSGATLSLKISDIRHFYKGSNPAVFLLENCVSGHSILFRRELIQYLDGFRNLIFHDWWLAYVSCNIGSINYINDCLVKYRQHDTTSTNILHSKKKKKKNHVLMGIEKEFQIVNLFHDYPFNKNKVFTAKLYELYQKRMNSYFSLSLALFIYKNKTELIYIKKKSAISKLNLIMKYAWGYKLKKLLG